MRMPKPKNTTISLTQEDLRNLGFMVWYYKTDKKALLHDIIKTYWDAFLKTEFLTTEHKETIPIKGDLAIKSEQKLKVSGDVSVVK